MIANAILWHWIGDPSLEGSYFMEPFIVWARYLNCFSAGMCPDIYMLNDINMQE